MRDIRVYDFEFNLLCIMTDVISSEWHLLYNGVGTYEGHFRLRDEISDIILAKRHIVIVQGDLQAICTGRIVNDELTVCGRTVNWILTKRVRPPFKTSEIFESYQDPETILLYCLKKGFTEPPTIDENGVETTKIDKNRVVSDFIIPAPVGAEKMTSHFWRISANDIETICVDLCEKLNRGHRVIFDVINKCWRFEFICPVHNEILIAKESKTAYQFELYDDLQDVANGGWYPKYDSETDENTSWHFIKNGTKVGIYDWDCVLSCSGESEAWDELIKKSGTTNIQSRLRNLQFGKDYHLGDIMSVYHKYGNISHEESYIVNGVDIKITADDSYEEPILKKYNV